MARQIVVEIVGDSSKFTGATKGAITQTETLGGKLRGVGKGVALGVGIGAFNLLAGAITGAISKLDEAHQAFLDDEVSSAKLGQAIKNNVPGNYEAAAAAAEKFAGAQANLGFADDDVRDSLGQLVGTTHDVETAQQLSALAMDIARAKGIDLATATDAVTKASEGQGRGLKALGIDIEGAKTGADLLAAAQTNVKGAAEAWAATNEGRLATSNVKVGEAMEKVGGIIDKVSQVVIPIFADALTWVVDALGQVWTAIQPVVSEIASVLIPIFKAVAPVVAQVFGAVIAAVRAVLPVFKSVFGAIGTVVGVLMNVFKAMQPALSAVFGVIGKVINTFATVTGVAFRIVGLAINALGRVFTGLGQLIGNIFGVIAGIVKGAINAVIGIVNGVIGAINSIQVHIHVGPVDLDWNGLNIGRIPKLHTGGIVPGTPGAEVLTLLQAGERVTPAGGPSPGGRPIVVQIDQFMGSDTEMERFADRLGRRLAVLAL